MDGQTDVHNVSRRPARATSLGHARSRLLSEAEGNPDVAISHYRQYRSILSLAFAAAYVRSRSRNAEDALEAQRYFIERKVRGEAQRVLQARTLEIVPKLRLRA
jgi:hypothetical protein